MTNVVVVAEVLALRKMAKNQAILAIIPTKDKANQKNAIMDLTAIVVMKVAKIANAIMVPIAIVVMINAQIVVNNNQKIPVALSKMG